VQGKKLSKDDWRGRGTDAEKLKEKEGKKESGKN